jgi:hypothetical protein
VRVKVHGDSGVSGSRTTDKRLVVTAIGFLSISALGFAGQTILTFDQARAKALEDAGYHQYGNLNKLQKERVDQEMEKYNYLPPTQRQPDQTSAPTERGLSVNGIPATPVGGGNYIDNTTGHFLQGAAGEVIDTETGQFLLTH